MPTSSFSSRSVGWLAGACVLGALGCGDTGQARVEYPLVFTGVSPDPFVADTDWEVTLSEAQLAFGPVFFCASTLASAELCPTAQAEFAAIVPLDLLSEDPVTLGQVNGVSGAINSLVMGYNYTWFIADTAPSSDPSVLDGHSAVLRGLATRGADSVAFSATIDILPTIRGGFALQLGGTRAEINSDEAQLDVSIDVRTWIEDIDFDELLALGQAEVEILPGTAAHSRITLAMTANETPSFVWSGPGVALP